EGLEKTALVQILARIASEAEHALRWFERALTVVEDDATAVATIESQLRRAAEFRARIQGLKDRVCPPNPPFDDSKLPPASDTPTAKGFISVNEARARTLAGRKP